GSREPAHERPETADASGLAFGGEIRQPEVGVREVPRRSKRQAITGWPRDQVERRSPVGLVQQRNQRGRFRERLGRGKRSIQEEAPFVEPANIDAYRARVDPDHSRHRGHASGVSEASVLGSWSFVLRPSKVLGPWRAEIPFSLEASG